MDAVMARWHGLSPEQRKRKRVAPETTEDHEARLEEAWQWLDRNPNDPKFGRHEDRWIAWLRAYEDAMRVLRRGASS